MRISISRCVMQSSVVITLCMHKCVLKCGEQSFVSGVFLHRLPLYSLGRNPVLTPEFVQQAGITSHLALTVTLGGQVLYPLGYLPAQRFLLLEESYSYYTTHLWLFL